MIPPASEKRKEIVDKRDSGTVFKFTANSINGTEIHLRMP